MCTKISPEKIKEKEIVGWKVIKVEGGIVCSYYYEDFTWIPNAKHSIFNSSEDEPSSQVFHCFAKKEHALRFMRLENKEWGTNYCYKRRVIKVILSGKLFKGTTSGIGKKCNDLPAVCGTKAYWDGKFIDKG